MAVQKNDYFEDFSFRQRVATPTNIGFYAIYFKRLFDIALVLLSLPILLPVTLLMALLVFAWDGHTPFYFSQRVGRGGRLFPMIKLRTMVHDADATLAAYLAANPAAATEWERTQKLKDDPRITLLGRLLRKTSLDELPQLLNVLWGDMSLVGPRPMMPEQRRLYPGTAYYELRPGVTGPWQVSARNLSTFAARADYDGEYIQNLSFLTDLRLLFRTVWVVICATGY